jgi:hypothetical protein
MVSPATPIERPLSLLEALSRAVETPGNIVKKTPPKDSIKTNLREAMDLINFPIKTRQSTLPWNQTPEDDQQGQYHDITVSKVKPKQWTSWRETLVQNIPHPPEDMAFKH